MSSIANGTSRSSPYKNRVEFEVVGLGLIRYIYNLQKVILEKVLTFFFFFKIKNCILVI